MFQNSFYIIGAVGLVIVAWYFYQIISRKKKASAFKLKKMLVFLPVYFITSTLLMKRGLPSVEAIPFGALIGLGAAWIVVKQPKMDRRIPTAIRRAVIYRDLGSKGLKWDSSRHHIDHIVPFSRNGDNSLRNLKVIDKTANLRKGAKMPKMRDFIRKNEIAASTECSYCQEIVPQYSRFCQTCGRSMGVA